MKTKPKKNTATAWAYTVAYPNGELCEAEFRWKRREAEARRRSDKAAAFICGPLTRVDLPLPKESKR